MVLGCLWQNPVRGAADGWNWGYDGFMTQNADLLQQARKLVNLRRYAEAQRELEHLLRRSPKDVAAWTLLAQLALQARQLDAALDAISTAARLAPHVPTVQYTEGRVYKARGDLVKAIDCYQRAAAADPGNADILTSLGIALRESGRLEEAVAVYRRALALVPTHALASNNLANALEALGARTQAEPYREAGRASLTREVDGLLTQALASRAQGKLHDAALLLEEALTIAPRSVLLLVTAATVASELVQGEDALNFYDRVIAIEADNFAALESARRLAIGAGLVERAQRYSEQLLRVSPTDDALIAMRLTLPAVEESRESIGATRTRYERALDELIQSDVSIADPMAVLGIMSFFLAYHGENDRDLQIKAAALYSKALPSLVYAAPHCTAAARRRAKTRIGFISRFLYAHSIGKTTRGLIEHIDRTQFEIHAIRVVPSADDDITALIRAAADRTVDVDSRLGITAAQSQIAELELDVIFYQDIGMDPFTYFLSFARLAHVQCVSYGHPNTTGVPAMDHFISNDLYETAESPSHYSERLFLLHDLPTLAYYYRPSVPSEPPGRAAFGLPADITIYICPQTLFKIHPDVDAIFKGILERDRRGRIVLIEGQFKEWSEKLAGRFRRTMADLADRILFLPSVPGERFMELLAASDVMLDPVHFNGMNSSLEAFAVGLPVVTLPARLQRGRHTRAMYLKMGITDCIAAGIDDYVDIAVRLGTDPAFRAQVHQAILRRNSALYEDARVVREFERFFATALEEKLCQAQTRRAGARPQV
jgi:protein O-GlcNAc transferase